MGHRTRSVLHRTQERENTHEVVQRWMMQALAIPETSSDCRPGAICNLGMINVFSEFLAYPGDGPANGQAPELRVEVWVRDVAYGKEVWLDSYELDSDGRPVRSEIIPLRYREPAGGDGDFFVHDGPLALPSPGMAGVSRRLHYRIYFDAGSTLFTDGLVHEQMIGLPSNA